MSKKTLSLIISLVIICAALLYVALSSDYKKAPIKTQTSATPVPSAMPNLASLSIVQNTTNQQTLDVVINAKTKEISAVQLEMQFNPQQLRVNNVQPGSFFKDPVIFLNTVDSKNGRISFALGMQPNGTPAPKGKGTVATLNFTPLSPGQTTSIGFLSSSLVTALGYNTSILEQPVPPYTFQLK